MMLYRSPHAVACTAIGMAVVFQAVHLVGQPAQRPMRVAVLVDTSAATASAVHLLRSGVAGLIDSLPPDAEMILVSTGRRTQTRVMPTIDREKVKQSVRSLTSDG